MKNTYKGLASDRTNLRWIIGVLGQHRIHEGRIISFSKSGYHQRHPDHQIIFNAMIFTRRQMVLRMVDLNLTLDAPALTAAAKEVGEDLFVLQEGQPYFSWQQSSMPLRQVLTNARWWTCVEPANRDLFLPVAAARRLARRFRLVCSVGTWQGKRAYALNCWQNEALDNENYVGGAIEMLGEPSAGLIINRCVEENEISVTPSKSRGRRVCPVFVQRTGLMHFVWFSNGLAVPAAIFGATVGKMHTVSYTSHKDVEAIHVRRQGEVIGLLWTSNFAPAQTVRSAHQELRRALGKNPGLRSSAGPPGKGQDASA